jgi:signal transduction histidine kinase
MFVPLLCAAALQAHAAHASTAERVPAAAAVGAARAVGDFLPHGYCFLWNRPLLITHVASDALIGVSYVVISLALVSLVHRARQDIPFHVLFVAFGLFIVACGMTHFVEIWTLWQPVYWISGAVKVVTAVASVTTAAVMPKTVPVVLATIRSAKSAREREVAAARTSALEEQNEVLQAQAVELELQTAQAQALTDELEQTNQALRRALATAEDATRTAEAANRAKGEFLAVMSHELRTPLNAVGGYAELLAEGVRGPVTDLQREDLGRIQRSQRHLLGLINEILNFTRVEAGQVQYDIADVPVAALVRDAAALVTPQATSKGLTVQVAPAAPGIAVRADGDKVQQILLNLLSNAVKFTPAGGVVALECAVADAQVRFRVRDTGPGIPADKLERVFEPFVQLDQRLTRTSEGIGLGLAISRDLARGMGGDLSAETTPGAGATFTLTLPSARPLA